MRKRYLRLGTELLKRCCKNQETKSYITLAIFCFINVLLLSGSVVWYKSKKKQHRSSTELMFWIVFISKHRWWSILNCNLFFFSKFIVFCFKQILTPWLISAAKTKERHCWGQNYIVSVGIIFYWEKKAAASFDMQACGPISVTFIKKLPEENFVKLDALFPSMTCEKILKNKGKTNKKQQRRWCQSGRS